MKLSFIFLIASLCTMPGFYASQLKAEEKTAEAIAPQSVPLMTPLQSFAPPIVVPESAGQVKLSFGPVVKKAAPAVVNIYATRVVKAHYTSPLLYDSIYRHFFGEEFFSGQSPTRIQRSLGSGVIVRPDGIIITNNHIIKDIEKIKVVLSDDREFDAVVVAREERTDLAALKLETQPLNLPYLPLRDMDELEVGDLVLAIGNPFGWGQTVTSGIISALPLTQNGVNDLRSFIQTDAEINPGNSGGALITLDGKLIGINTALFSQTGGSVGMGFAIPSILVVPVIASVDQGGKIIRPWLGADVHDVTPQIASSYSQGHPMGALIKGIYPGSPAEKAGLKVGDIIVSFDNQEVVDAAALNFKIFSCEVDHNARFKVIRLNQSPIDVNVKLEAPPESQKAPLELRGRSPLSGATVADLSPALSAKLGVSFMTQGVIVTNVRRHSLAYRIGVLPGDIIQSLNGLEIKTVDDLVRQLTRIRGEWKIILKREGEVYDINLKA